MKRGDKRRNNPGRPPGDAEERKAVIHTIRLTQAENVLVRGEAERANMTLSSWWRVAMGLVTGR